MKKKEEESQQKEANNAFVNTPTTPTEKTNHTQYHQQENNSSNNHSQKGGHEEEEDDDDNEWVKADCIISDHEDSLERSQPSLTVSPTSPEMLTPIPLSEHSSPSPSMANTFINDTNNDDSNGNGNGNGNGNEDKEKTSVNHSVESSPIPEIEKKNDKDEMNIQTTSIPMEEGAEGERMIEGNDQIGMALSPRQ